jgi:hypothetical protein
METSNTWNGSWFDQSNVDMAFFIRCSDTANSLKNITCIGLWGLSKNGAILAPTPQWRYDLRYWC